MSDGAGRPARFFDELTDMFRRTNSSPTGIFGEDSLYGMSSVTNNTIQKHEENLCAQLFWEIRI